MCGIIGIASNARLGRLPTEERQRRALAALHHRGPDAQGEYRDGQLWLGHTRLSILDLSSAGAQPMRSADERYVITYNGEIYNFKELARRFGLSGLRSSSDTEVVLRLFAERGIAALSELNGMFAFAIYDREARKVWLARDRIGIKPLYFSFSNQALTFASEIKGILALCADGPSCNAAALHEWLYFGNSLGERTLYEGVSQLLPGCYLELDLQSFKWQIKSFWSQGRHAGTPLELGSSKLDASRTRELLEQAVQRQLVSDVPVGIFLSGGVDSSAITAFASRAYGKLATYSAGFDFGDSEAELLKARGVAQLYGTEHHEMHIAGKDAAGLVEKMVRAHDAPFADPANIPLYLMALEISRHSKVVLQGDGGDELFGGYRRYHSLTRYRSLHLVALAARYLLPLAPTSQLRERARRYVRAFAADDFASTLALLLTPEDPVNRPESVFAPQLREALSRTDPLARPRECAVQFRSDDPANVMSAVDLATTLPDLYLQKVDRATMAASLEVRVPFLDNELVDFVMALPSSRKIPRGQRKWLLKSALRGIVPDAVLFGPKVGLDVPFAQWLRGSLREFFLDQLSSFAREFPGVLDTARVRLLFEQHRAGGGGQSYLLWKVLNLMVWAHGTQVRFIESAVN